MSSRIALSQITKKDTTNYKQDFVNCIKAVNALERENLKRDTIIQKQGTLTNLQADSLAKQTAVINTQGNKIRRKNNTIFVLGTIALVEFLAILKL